MSQPAADRNLLFGMLALKMDFVTREQLTAGMQAWALEKDKSLGQILRDQNVLPEENLALLETLVQKHLAKHENDPQKSLAVLSGVTDVKQDLVNIADADVQASLASCATFRPAKPVELFAPAGRAPTGGMRFRILRPHARGGLGEVFVASDDELHREVALKEIQERQADNEESRARFLLEAEITGGLEHPGIVPVYGLGVYGDGRPYYAMRFIRGDSLKGAIEHFHKSEAAMPPGERNVELRALLRRFVDVCNAIAYAHSRGILHRDLKPGNIMLGKYGETLVVDWGLAKPLGQTGEPVGRSEPGEGSLIPHSISSSSQTLAGAALGTPQYMSPEQAAGKLDQLGPTSDVYSLGATLYCLLTGQPSLTDYDVPTILQKVQRGEFLKPSHIKKSVPPALEAVCLKAMALKAEDRYQTSHALADDIEHWLADEPVSAWPEPWTVKARRWIGRHRVLVTSAAAALAVALSGFILATVLLTAAHERETLAKLDALKQKAIAEQNFKLARQAVDRYHTEVSQSVLLNEPGMQPLRKKLLEAAREYYAKFITERAGDLAVRGELGRATFRLAQITGEIDAPLKAIELHREAIAILGSLPADQADADVRFELAAAWHHLGRLNRLVDRKEESAQAYGHALSLWELLLKDSPQEERYQAGLARTELGLGNVEQLMSRLDPAKDHYQRALAIRLPLARAHPESAEYQRDLAVTYNNLAITYRNAGQDQDAKQAYQSALRIQQKLADAAPNISQYQDDLARTNANLGDLYARVVPRDQAVAYYLEAARIRQKLAAEHPAVIDFQLTLARSYLTLANVYRGAKDWRKAEDACRDALAIQRRLADRHPDVPDRQAELGGGLYTLGNVYRSGGQLEKAIAAYRETLPIQTRLANAHPGIPHYPTALADTYNSLGLALAADKKLDQAADAYLQAKTIWDRLIKDHPAAAEHRRDLAITCENLGNLAKARGQYEQALDWYTQALDRAPKTERAFILYSSAAVCSLQAEKADREEVAGAFASRAVKLLTDAGHAAFYQQRDAYRQKLASDPEMQFLRSRPEFKSFAEELKSK